MRRFTGRGFQGRNPEGVGMGKRILLAEDDQAQREILQELLEFEGYEVQTASTAAELLAGLDFRPHALVMDWVGVSSPSVMNVLSTAPRRPKVLLVSGDQALPKLAERMGADGFLAKPYDITELLAQLRQAVGSMPPEESFATQ
jgi:DNA-binding response OmpR family regulator